MAVTLYVGNLPWGMTEDGLAEVFRPLGSVLAVRIITDRSSGRSRGFGFVELDGIGLEEAISKMSGVEVSGRRLTVGPGHPKPARY
jgi:RNA recognition motif-containing protein